MKTKELEQFVKSIEKEDPAEMGKVTESILYMDCETTGLPIDDRS